MQKAPITRAGYQTIVDELQRFKTTERQTVIAAIAEARAHGDLSENAEYDAAKERQGFVEARINELEGLVACAEVVDPENIDADIVVFGATVTLINIDTEEEVQYSIVGDSESNPEKGRIGISTPVARALMGKEELDEITVTAPGGKRTFEIQTIEYKAIVR